MNIEGEIEACLAPSNTQVVQGSAAWFAARLGKVTASRIGDMLATTKTGWGASRANYLAELVSERLTGQPTEGFKSSAMQYGTEIEPEARREYEFFRNIEVVECGFVPHPHIAMSGASPDGLIGDDGVLEIKSPNTATHIETLRGAAIPKRYELQQQWQLACTGRKWCDFVSFDRRMPDNMRLFVRRTYRDDAKIREVEKEVIAFLREVNKTIDDLTSKFGPVPEPVPSIKEPA